MTGHPLLSSKQQLNFYLLDLLMQTLVQIVELRGLVEIEKSVSFKIPFNKFVSKVFYLKKDKSPKGRGGSFFTCGEAL